MTGAPLDRGLGRVVRIVVVAGVVVLALWGAAIFTWKRAAVEHGETLLGHREGFREKLAPPTTAQPRIVWLGDSTILHDSYPQLLEPWFAKTYGAESRIASAAGMTTYNYYSLMGPALDVHPTMVVFLANLRMFRTHKPGGAPVEQFGDDLASMIPLSELPRAMTLPWMARSISLAHVLLVRTLQIPWVERAVVLTAGLGDTIQARSPWELVAAPPPPLPPSVALGVFFAGLHVQAELYDVKITDQQPYVRMMAAAIQMATCRGVPVVVIASPIPLYNLKDFGLPAEAFAARFAKLREIAEGAGATFLDYHDKLERPSFADNVGHYTPEGAQTFADMLQAPLASAMTTALARQPH